MTKMAGHHKRSGHKCNKGFLTGMQPKVPPDQGGPWTRAHRHGRTPQCVAQSHLLQVLVAREVGLKPREWGPGMAWFQEMLKKITTTW